MHARPRHDPHEIRHWRAFEVSARWFGIFSHIDVWLHHVPCRIHIVPEQAGGMVLVLLNDLEITQRRVEAFTASRELRNADEHAALVEIGALLAEADLHRRAYVGAMPVPVGDGVSRRTTFCSPISASQILRPRRIPRVVAATCDE